MSWVMDGSSSTARRELWRPMRRYARSGSKFRNIIVRGINTKAFIMSIRYDVHCAVAVITVDNPPVNSLGHDVRAGIAACVDHAQADEAVKAIIIIGTEKAFSAGADIRELDTPRANA